jgi:D-beta-D-heptose 7-phosphate kinase / D-beta-D-heptose 1-phosphate adenosyltransferase
MSFVEKFRSVRILCIGDVMLDRFIDGDVKRISPESPVPIISLGDSVAVPGGAANVARNITSLGGECVLVGLIGTDQAGLEIADLLKRDKLISSRLVRSADRPTTEKIRFVAQGQHVLRADRERNDSLSPQLEDEIIKSVLDLAANYGAVILSDYAKGVISDKLIREVIRISRNLNIPVIVDPKSARLERYSGATLITPNSKELYAATGLDPSISDQSAVEAGRMVLNRIDIDNVLVTRAEKGMTLVTRHAEPVHITASAREVSDVVGAGDTVIAALSLAIGGGAPLDEAATIANLAAGIVVAKHGTATVTQSELLEAIANRDRSAVAGTVLRVLSLQETLSRAELWRRDGLHIGFTNGCFDILHMGHIKLLNFAKMNCDRLIVGLNSDASVRRLKGPERPINMEIDRAQIISFLNMVDAVVLFDEDTPESLIRQLSPDVLVKGADYEIGEIVGANFVLSQGGSVLRCELMPERSTTRIITQAAGSR